MIEIVCPNCGARYQVPAEALGQQGRDVTCSSCGHVWHARPPQPEPAPQPQSRAYEPEAEPAPEPAGDNRDRRRQMADIRQMLDEVQTAERRRGEAAQPPAEGTQRWSERDAPATRDRRRPQAGAAEEEDDFFLRDKVGVGGQSGRLRSVRERARDGETDRRKMMERHGKRERKQEAARKRGSGWGYTGFTLVILMFAVFVGLYAFHPAIAEKYPGMAPAMADYAAAVETLRTGADAVFGDLTGFVSEKIAEFSEGEG